MDNVRESAGHRHTVSLAGVWAFALDPEATGVGERLFAGALTETITLPGTTDEAHKGEFVDERCDDRLSRVWRWIGPAWYRRTLDIPSEWAGKHLELFLERTKNSRVWVDDEPAGGDDSLSTPHRYDLSALLTPGSHRLTILVDNARLPPVGPCHQVDERTQTNWNGIVGRIELRVSEPVGIDDIQVYPSAHDRRLRMVVGVRNSSDAATTTAVEISVSDARTGGELGAVTGQTVVDARSRADVACRLVLPEGVGCWDEFDRPLLRVEARLSASLGTAMAAGGSVVPDPPADDQSRLRRAWVDRVEVVCGLRDFVVSGNRLVVNGRRIFLRGKVDSALFPLTGYAPMDTHEWERLFGIALSYGINHYRFHSWCPPEAAFRAADELGVYLQVELPNNRPMRATTSSRARWESRSRPSPRSPATTATRWSEPRTSPARGCVSSRSTATTPPS